MFMNSTFPLGLDEFSRWLQAQGRREGTIVEYVRSVRRAVNAGDLLEPLRSAQSRSSWLIAYSAMAAYGEAAGLGDIRPELKHVPPPRRPPTVRRPVPEDAWAAIVARIARLPEPDRAVMQALVLSGLRIGDVLGITRGQAQRVVATGSADIWEKGGREREWAPGADVREALARLLARPKWERIQDLVARHPKTAQGRVRRLLRRVCDEAGVPHFVPHAFRHSMASSLDERGKSLQEIAAVLGHASTRTTEGYVHISAARQARAADEVAGSIVHRGTT
jgi:integrase